VEASIASGPLRAHALREIVPAAAVYEWHEPRGIWKALLPAVGITPSRGIFVDVGTACDMVDGAEALKLGFAVLGFETRPDCVASVRKAHAAAFANGSVELCESAVSNVSRRMLTLYDAGDSASVDHLAVAKGLEATLFRGKTHAVTTVTLDEVVSDRPVAVIKIDIQGHEFEALMGADALLSRPPDTAPLVQFEYYERFRPDLKRHNILHLMRGKGYTCFDLTAGNKPIWRWLRPRLHLFSEAECRGNYPGLLQSFGLWDDVLREWAATSQKKRTGLQRSFKTMVSQPPRGFGCPGQLATDFACAKGLWWIENTPLPPPLPSARRSTWLFG